MYNRFRFFDATNQHISLKPIRKEIYDKTIRTYIYISIISFVSKKIPSFFAKWIDIKKRKKKKKAKEACFFHYLGHIQWKISKYTNKKYRRTRLPLPPSPHRDATISQRSRQGARGKAMVLDEHRPRFPSDPSSNSPSGARRGACRAP